MNAGFLIFKRKAVTGLDVLFAFILFVLLNFLAGSLLSNTKLDLTEDGLFTLTPATLKIAASMEEPIKLKYFFSNNLTKEAPAIRRYGQRVQELLERYVTASSNMIQLEVIDPGTSIEHENIADRSGLRSIEMKNGAKLYFGLIGTNSTDGVQIIPFFTQEKEHFLEYELTQLMHRLSMARRPVIGLLTSHQMHSEENSMMSLHGRSRPSWAIVDFVRKRFELRILKGFPIPDNLDALLIVHPGLLDEKILYAIDQYVLKGGKLIAFVDPYSEVAISQRNQGSTKGIIPRKDSNLESLLNRWGVSIVPGKIIGDFNTAQKVDASSDGQQKIIPYLPWLRLSQRHLNQNDIVTNGLGSLNIASAGSIVEVESSETKLTPLVETSKNSMLLDADLLSASPHPERLIEFFKSDKKKHVIAARIAGLVSSSFPDGPPRSVLDQIKNTNKKLSPHHDKSLQSINLIVIADTDLLFDQLWQRKQRVSGQEISIPIAANANLLMNALENLSGSTELVNLRLRSKSSRPLSVLNDMNRSAEQQFLKYERDINNKIKRARQNIETLSSKDRNSPGPVQVGETKSEISKARAEIDYFKKQIQQVRRKLHDDVDRLQATIKFANIGLIPIVIGLSTPLILFFRSRRRYTLSIIHWYRFTQMKPRIHKGLTVIVGLFFFLSAWILYDRDFKSGPRTLPEKIFPDLNQDVNSIVSIIIETRSGVFRILKSTANKWIVPKKHGYPANLETVKKTILGISNLKPIELKTKKSTLHGKLHLNKPQDLGKGILITLQNAEDVELASILLGKVESPGSPNVPELIYVRKAKDNQAWLAEAKFKAPDEIVKWLDSRLPIIQRRRIQSVKTIKQGNKSIYLFRTDPNDKIFHSHGSVSLNPTTKTTQLAQLPAGTVLLKAAEAEKLISSLEMIRFDDVMPISQYDIFDAISAEFTTFEGLIVELKVKFIENKYWVNFRARFDPTKSKLTYFNEKQIKGMKTSDDARSQGLVINQKHNPWWYQIPAHKGKAFLLTKEDITIVKPPPE